jgi:hypothetical protein
MTNALIAATIRLGLMLSVVAAGVAAGLSLIGDVSPWSLALAVATVGFVASWNQTGRITHTERTEPAVVVADIPVHRALHRPLG